MGDIKQDSCPSYTNSTCELPFLFELALQGSLVFQMRRIAQDSQSADKVPAILTSCALLQYVSLLDCCRTFLKYYSSHRMKGVLSIYRFCINIYVVFSFVD